MTVKKCAFCAEEIQAEAVKCRFCGEFLNKKPGPPWYFRNMFIIIMFACVGPLSLPLVWFNPRFSVTGKIVVTVITLILSYYLCKGVIKGSSSLLTSSGLIDRMPI